MSSAAPPTEWTAGADRIQHPARVPMTDYTLVQNVFSKNLVF
jgi:hypothetical protein